MGQRPSTAGILDDLRAEQRELRAIVDGVELDRPTPVQGWDVRETVVHLATFDEQAALAAADPQAFLARLAEAMASEASMDAFMDQLHAPRRALAREELLLDWQDGLDKLVDAVGALDPAAKVPWYGPPMSPASCATARLMEYWAHGQDVADAAGVRREPTERLRHICHLGHRTRGFSYAVRGLAAPDVEVAAVLDAPGGGTWTFGDPSAPERVTGPAEDFCLLVTQRRHRSDTALVATGPAAEEWLGIAQCFAGPPGPGRAPLASA